MSVGSPCAVAGATAPVESNRHKASSCCRVWSSGKDAAPSVEPLLAYRQAQKVVLPEFLGPKTPSCLLSGFSIKLLFQTGSLAAEETRKVFGKMVCSTTAPHQKDTPVNHTPATRSQRESLSSPAALAQRERCREVRRFGLACLFDADVAAERLAWMNSGLGMDEGGHGASRSFLASSYG